MPRFKLSLLLLLLSTTVTTSAYGASHEQFWREFKRAIEKNDRAAVANMTKLPFLWESKPLNRQQFMAKYDTIFPKTARQAILKTKPIDDKGSSEIFAGETIYVFSNVGGKFMFTDIGVND